MSTIFSDVGIEMYHIQLAEALSCDIVGLNARGIATSEIKQRYIVGEKAHDPSVECVNFTAQMIISNLP